VTAARTSTTTAAIARRADADGRFAPGAADVPWRALLLVLVVSGALHGAAMGSYGLRAWQAAFSAVKGPLLLAAATAFVLPNFYVVNALLGLRDDLREACRAVLAAQATLAVALAATAPPVVVVYASTADYRTAVVANGAAFAVATACAQTTLARRYRPLVARNPRHRTALRAWLVLFVFVAIQFAWVLRPFVGSPRIPTRFLREDAWSNAYVVVWGLAVRFLGGG
jgi:hypothetical protein